MDGWRVHALDGKINKLRRDALEVHLIKCSCAHLSLLLSHRGAESSTLATHTPAQQQQQPLKV